MATDADNVPFQPPYMSWATFEGILDQLAAVGIPDQIDRSVLASRSGGDQSQFLRAARAFGLIDANDAPTDRLRALVGQAERRPAIYKQILQENYADVIALGTGATQQQLTDQFREFGIEGDTVRKAIAFYLSAARQAEIPLSPRFKTTRPGAGGRRAVRRTTRKVTPPPGDNGGAGTTEVRTRTKDCIRPSSPSSSRCLRSMRMGPSPSSLVLSARLGLRTHRPRST